MGHPRFHHTRLLKTVEMDRTHAKKNFRKHHTPGPELEGPRKRRVGQPKKSWRCSTEDK